MATNSEEQNDGEEATVEEKKKEILIINEKISRKGTKYLLKTQPQMVQNT